MESLFKNHSQLLNSLGPVYKRQVFERFETGHRISGIVGSRGIGKTTYLLNYIKEHYGNSSQALFIQ